jgi:Fe2+ transport system protein FeoA
MRLTEGVKGKEYRIVKVWKGEECKEDCPVCVRLRMLEFGLLKGESIEILLEGNPMMVRLGDWKLGMREDEAERIEIE